MDRPDVPETTSYLGLLVVLQRRLDRGWKPDDMLYFTELTIELIEAYRLSTYRAVSCLENSFALPAHEKSDLAKTAKHS
jgi:hypothetical protein